MSDDAPHAPIRQGDLDALVEACLCDGYSFGQITKAIREEWPDVGIRRSITFAAWSIQSIGQCNDALGATARMTWQEWHNAHPGIKV